MIFQFYIFATIIDFTSKVTTDNIVKNRLKKENFIFKDELNNTKCKLIRYGRLFLESMIPFRHVYDSYNNIFNSEEVYYKIRKTMWINGEIYKNSNISKNITKKKETCNIKSETFKVEDKEQVKDKNKILVKKLKR